MSASHKNTEEELNLRALAKPYLRHWKLIGFSFIAFLIIAFVYLKYATPVYNITGSVLIQDANQSRGDEMNMISDVQMFGGFETNSVDNELEIFNSKKLMRDVVKDNNLQFNVYVKNGLKEREVFGVNAPIGIKVIAEQEVEQKPEEKIEVKLKENNKVELLSPELPKEQLQGHIGDTLALPYADVVISKNPEYKQNEEEEIYLSYASLKSRVNSYQNKLKVDLANKNATTILLSMNEAESKKAQIIVNGLVTAYNTDAVENKNQVSKNTLNFLNERLDVITEELSEVESEKEQFKRENSLLDIQTKAELGVETSSEAKLKERELETQININNALMRSLEKQEDYSLLPVNVGLESSDVNSSINQYNNLILQRQRHLETATAEHPTIIDFENQIKSLRANILEALRSNEHNLEIRKKDFKEGEESSKSEFSELPHQELQYRSIERNLNLKENIYLLLLEKREETLISLNITAPKARIIDQAYVSPSPVSPKNKIVYLAAGLLGVLIPIGGIYLKDLLSNKIESKDEIVNAVNAQVLAEIPGLETQKETWVQPNDFSFLAEAFRILSVQLNFMIPSKDKGKTILVTSTVKGEGKTFSAVNLALTLAYSSEKVALIGGDLRNPQLSRFNTPSKREMGLSEFLHNSETDVDNIISGVEETSNLKIIHSGALPPNPTTLLSGPNFGVMLKELKKKFDYVIIDSAPLSLVSDTFLITKYADLTLYAVRYKYTEKEMLEFIKEHIDNNKIKNPAFVLNGIKKERMGYYNKYGYNYNDDQPEDKTLWKRIKENF